jgi:RNA polymerase sigma-70 factor, ECF subfamily
MSPSPAPPTDESFENLRPLLLSIAYRMVGSRAEAEDLVQEAFVRFHQATRRGDEIASTKAFLATVTTRLAIDHLRSARVRREAYVGPWLPEPLVDEMTPDITRTAELAESLSTAFLVLLETLSPTERAVFLLRDVFDYDYATVGEVVGKSEANTRQIASRARRRIAVAEPRFEPSPRERDRLAARFFAAARGGDVDGLVDMLAADAVFTGDGGGKGNGLPRPVADRAQIARLLVAFTRRATDHGGELRPIHVGGQPGVLLTDADGRVAAVWSLRIAGGVVHEVLGVVNPDKLAHLGPVSPYAYRPQHRDPAPRGTTEEGARHDPDPTT